MNFSELQICDNRNQWNDFVFGVEHTPFHQLWEWGELEKSRGEIIWRIFCEKKVGSGGSYVFAQVIIHNLPFGLSYAWVPKCAFYDKEFILAVKNFLKSKHKLIFCQWEFCVMDVGQLDVSEQYDKNLYLKRKLVKPRVPEQTLVLNLEKSHDQLLSEMKQKCRYNLNLSKRKGVTVEIKNNPTEKEIENFAQLLKQTGKRDGFEPVSKAHLIKLFEFFNRGGLSAYLIEAKLHTDQDQYTNQDQDEKILAASLLICAGDTITYLHGASDYNGRALMAPYLMQWESIIFGKSNGYKFYDFWGIAIDGLKEENWSGITRFKLGFGGEIVQYKKALRHNIKPLAAIIYNLVR